MNDRDPPYFRSDEDPVETVFVLHHVHEAPSGEEDTKMIGVHSSEDEAKAAIERLKTQPGFRDHVEGFCITPYRLNQDEWREGFVSWAEAL